MILVTDGNFKADHVQQKEPKEPDVWLSDGSGMQPNKEKYFEFLKHAFEMLTVSYPLIAGSSIGRSDNELTAIVLHQRAPCENTFRAIMNALLASKVCDRTGIAAMACARHGCFVPTSIVNFFKGEQQKNIDFAFLQAIEYLGIDPEQGALLIYDIACQYMVHFLERIGEQVPEDLTVEAAIGLFHVHAHKDSCFFRYATTFIPGAGNVAGEILESLWSCLNAISPSTRTATLAHRSEILDDHTCDSNHKKALGMRATLCKRSIEANTTLNLAKQYYDELTAAAGPIAVTAWEATITAAENKRKEDLTVMDIYAAAKSNLSGPNLSGPEKNTLSPIDTWMDYALIVEEEQ